MLLVRINTSGHYFTSGPFDRTACRLEQKNLLIRTSTGTNQTNSLMTSLFTKEFNVLNLLYHFPGELLIFFKTRIGDGFLCSRCRTPGSQRRLQSNLLATFPKEKLSVDFGTRCQALPRNPAFFFSFFQTRWLRILLKKCGGWGGG